VQSSLSKPYVVTVVPETPAEATGLTVGELLVGSVSMAGVMLTAALLLGIGLAGVRVVMRRRFPPVTDHMPPISALDDQSPQPPSPAQ
jgi:hypothetical protein